MKRFRSLLFLFALINPFAGNCSLVAKFTSNDTSLVFFNPVFQKDLNAAAKPQFKFSMLDTSSSVNVAYEGKSGSYWFYFKIVNLQDSARTLFLKSSIFERISFFIKDQNKVKAYQRGYYYYNEGMESYLDRFGLTLKIQAKDTLIVLCHAIEPRQTNKYQYFNFTISDYSEYRLEAYEFYYKQRVSNAWNILFLSILFFQLLYTLVQGMVVKKPEYAYYFCYIFCVGIYFLGRNEMTLELRLFFFDYQVFYRSLNDTLLFLPYFFYYRFARFFANTQSFNPKLTKQIKLVEWIILAISICIYFVGPSKFFSSYSGVVILPILLFLLSTSIYFLFKIIQFKNKVSQFLVVGSSFALVASVLANLISLLPIAQTNALFYSPLFITQMGVIIELLIFNTGLIFKARLDETEKFEIQRKLILERSEKDRLEKEHLKQKDRIASELHDDLGAGLSTIRFLSEVGKSKEHNKIELNKISVLSNDLVDNMRQIIWTINPNNSSWEDSILYIKKYAAEYLETHQLNFDFSFKGIIPNKAITGQLKRNLFLVMKECLHNIVKHSKATQVNIQFDFSELLQISISDNGVGFSLAETENKDGLGLKSMKKRMEEIEGTYELNSKNGTITKLTLPLETGKA
jgi:signal transduction histidine kinase